MARTSKKDPRALIHEVFTEESAHMGLEEAVADFPVARIANKSVTRCAFLVLDHNAYHLGEFAILRQVMALWPKSRKSD